MARQEVYTHGHAASVLRSHSRRTAQDSAAYLLPHLRPGDVLLDVGCGPGTITSDLARLVAPGPVLGVDREHAPLPAAIRHALDVLGPPALGPPAGGVPADGVHCGFAVADVYDLPLADATIDVVHAHQVLQHLVDPVAALRELARVCRPGGLLAARDADYAAFTWWPADPWLDAWLELYRACARDNRAEPDAGRRLFAWAHEAGLTDVTATASVWCYAAPADRAWWGGLWAERILDSALAGQAQASGRATRDDLVRMSRAWRDWSVAEDGWFLVPHGEILVRRS